MTLVITDDFVAEKLLKPVVEFLIEELEETFERHLAGSNRKDEIFRLHMVLLSLADQITEHHKRSKEKPEIKVDF